MQKFRFKTYELTERAVTEGIAYGIRRAHKHTDTPTIEHLEIEIEHAVMQALSEVIDFEADAELIGEE